ncbi:MAG: 50S ribosomal protein L9 [bacterium]|nr:50S ribosomal protein L9 [bacterium]
MKVVLLQNISGVGQKYSVKDVKPGFWRNFLSPQNLAKEATIETLKQIEIQKRKSAIVKRSKEENVLDNLKEINGKTIEFEAKSGKNGNLFAGISADQVREIIKEKISLDISSDLIQLEKPIKKIGAHHVSVKDFFFTLEVKPQR